MLLLPFVTYLQVNSKSLWSDQRWIYKSESSILAGMSSSTVFNLLSDKPVQPRWEQFPPDNTSISSLLGYWLPCVHAENRIKGGTEDLMIALLNIAWHVLDPYYTFARKIKLSPPAKGCQGANNVRPPTLSLKPWKATSRQNNLEIWTRSDYRPRPILTDCLFSPCTLATSSPWCAAEPLNVIRLQAALRKARLAI